MFSRCFRILPAMFVAATSIVFPVSLLMAHPGHGNTDPASTVHHLVEPGHAAPAVVVLGLVALVTFFIRYQQRPTLKRIKARRSAE